jgi:hypothetical protein
LTERREIFNNCLWDRAAMRNSDVLCRNPRIWHPILRALADQAAGIQPRTRSCDAHLHLHRHQSVWTHRVPT